MWRPLFSVTFFGNALFKAELVTGQQISHDILELRHRNRRVILGSSSLVIVDLVWSLCWNLRISLRGDMDRGVLLESPQGSQSSSRVEHARALSSRAVEAVSRFPSCGSRDLWLSLEAFPRGFPRGFSHVPPCCESILMWKSTTNFFYVPASPLFLKVFLFVCLFILSIMVDYSNH